MKIRENITLYICEHCGKRYIKKSACEKHEYVCRCNPDNIPLCYSCKYFTQETFEHEEGHGGGYHCSHYTTMYCSKLKEELRPITSLKKGNSILGQTPPDMVTPKKCEHFRLYSTI